MCVCGAVAWYVHLAKLLPLLCEPLCLTLRGDLHSVHLSLSVHGSCELTIHSYISGDRHTHST